MFKKFYIVDISSFVFRAYYGIKNLTTSKGVATNATYGVVTMLLKLLKDKKPDYLVLAFDSPTPSFRKKIYTDYKANREVPPEDLPPQFEAIKKFVNLYPLPSLQADGFEADDIIATLVKEKENFFKGQQIELVIVSGDKDLMQLVGENVVMYDAMKDKKIGVDEVKEKFGVLPSQVLDVLSLSGDASDNIPGVPGIGDKTASKLISEWGSVEKVLENAPSIKGKLGENLAKHKDEAILSKKLATLHDSVPLSVSENFFHVGEPSTEKLIEFYNEYEFHTLANLVSVKKETRTENRKFDLILKEEELATWCDSLQKSKGFSLDTETTSKNARTAKLVGISFSNGEGKAAYIPLDHRYLGCPAQLDIKKVSHHLKPVLENKNISKYFQNAKYDLHVLHNIGLEVLGNIEDTMIASYLLDSEGAHDMDFLAQKYLGYTTIKFADIVPKGQTFDGVSVELACDYSAEDAEVTYRLYPIFKEALQKQNLEKCYEEIDKPLIPVLLKMEQDGVLIDKPLLKNLGSEFLRRLEQLEADIQRESGSHFNVNSPKQVGDILFNKLNLPTQKKTKTGLSTDVEVLKTLAGLHPVPKMLLEHRMLSKLQSTYVEQLTNLIDPNTNRIHTSFNQSVTATGRLSSTDPNLQNIPIKTEDGKKLRQVFVAPPGHVILSADYSQIELRLLAAFSKDPTLVEAFQKDEDIHAMTAGKIFEANENPSKLRSMAKTVNFGIIYGQSAYGLSHLLGISPSEAKKIIEDFYKKFPSVLEYKEKTLGEIRKAGEVRTWMGRRRLVPEINSQNKLSRQNAERTAFNTIFQGSAADLIKVAMIRIQNKLNHSEAKMIMQVHDELVFEVKEDKASELSRMIKKEMEEAISCEVPLKVEVGQGNNWGEAH